MFLPFFQKGETNIITLRKQALIDNFYIQLYKSTNKELFFSLLLRRYKGFIRELSHKVLREYKYSKLISQDELYSIGLECLHKAVMTCRKDSPLKPYWYTIAKRSMHNYASRTLRLYSNKIVTPNNNSLYDDKYISSGVVDDYFLYKDSEVRSFVLKFARKRKIEKAVQIFDLHMAGYRAAEVAKILKIKTSRVYRIINILKDEIRNHYL